MWSLLLSILCHEPVHITLGFRNRITEYKIEHKRYIEADLMAQDQTGKE